MFNGNLYGLIVTMLTFVIAVVLTMRQVEQRGIHFELTIRPVSAARLSDLAQHQADQDNTGIPAQQRPMGERL